MIVVDASAIVAMLLDEPEREAFLERISGTQARLSPVGYWEAAIKLERQRGTRGLVELDALLADLDIRIEPADVATAKAAVVAANRFGKRMPARLNLGDCFAYALARNLNAPLLYKGDDFPLTDIKPALNV